MRHGHGFCVEQHWQVVLFSLSVTVRHDSPELQIPEQVGAPVTWPQARDTQVHVPPTSMHW